MEIFWDGLLDALIDTAIVLPILYLAYLLVSYFSHNDNEKYSKILHRTNKAGPLIGAFLGCIPQCGFSSVMSQLYSKKIVTLGTLIAVFIATSDEAIPLMISKPEFIPKLLILILIKVVYAIIVGYMIDGLLKLFNKRNRVLNVVKEKQKISESLKDNVHEEDGENDSQEIIVNVDCANILTKHNHEHKCKHANEEEHGHNNHSHCCATNIFLDALHHTLIIILYVFLATLAINLIRGYCGGLEPLQKFFTGNVYIQILMASLIGLIPNCAASIFLVEMYMESVLLFPALVAGLSAGAGVGLIVLFTTNYKKVWTNISIVVMQYIFAFLIGIVTSFIPIW